ncbi:uncharacterized protein [Aristolochia californica]|uniref:uncharacterized protein n=1 Tax=Aristolochia californica TaxID=171875 RepID=UPI0035DED645
MNGNFEKYSDERNLLMIIASVLDPMVKLRLIEIDFPEIYSEVEVKINVGQISEFTFSVSGKVIDPFHYFFALKTIQALICSVDWIMVFHVKIKR